MTRQRKIVNLLIVGDLCIMIKSPVLIFMFGKKQKAKKIISENANGCSPLERLRGKLPRLEEADLIFVRNKKSLLRYFLRRSTKSYWDHIALVLFVKDLKKDHLHNLIIEAVDPSGIEIHKLDKYLCDPDKYEIGIKRVPNLSPEIKNRVMSYMLLNVDTPYYKFSFIKFALANLFGWYGEVLLARQRYSCSGFVQKAFYEAAGWEERDDFIFREDFLSPIELQEITTPGDIARSDKSKWIYNKH